MSRPFRCRKVGLQPVCRRFGPSGGLAGEGQAIHLQLDELEAIRLADVDGLYQEDAAKKMGISRQTFGNIIDSAHKKVAEAIINANEIKIEGGEVKMMERRFVCFDCKKEWALPYGAGRPLDCPTCQSKNIHRATEDRGCGRNNGLGRGQGRGNRACRRA
ncbi:hypothetical protein A2311_01270 [candidate division WOR-1 bacterium RIFOXYB2_FULL_48_7]|uniref:UPF0251 protein A2311_01270 n=1 Tax=candidate division WOR-1 bacterium RIFOXYB2_FULL_48_7 TaxID=1802583 RepID=A0A1F4TNK1_UNCSA|nr:MAG: hypothetical protein A2311_01270 [candidate division WOR-1 bacterium RIFOXYB2_FULL_48_7]